ncbi:MAG TPA: urease accessory protein UreD [Blastocatellia bacterium]|nr:urease accessory protein UreD [Blastocatellia bacterium]
MRQRLSTYAHQDHQSNSRRRIQGRLRLDFTQDPVSQQTILSSSEQQPPLRVVRAFPFADGAVLLHLHNISGGVLGGDYLEMEIGLGRNARAQLTTTGATRLYRRHASVSDAMQINRVTIGEDAWLEYLPDPLIPFAGAGYRQHTRIDLDQGAGLFWWEVVAPGREARGELFDYERLDLKLEIRVNGRLVALERNRLEPRLRPLDSPSRLGNYRYFASFYICRAGLEAASWLALEEELQEIAVGLSRPTEIAWGISALPAHGLAVRALSVNGREITAGLTTLWRAAKLKLYGLEAVSPRKTY